MRCPQSRPCGLPSAVPSPEGSRPGAVAEGSALGAEPAGAAHTASESGGAGGAPRAPVQAGRLLLQPALIDSSALVYRGAAGLLSWQEGGGRAESSAATAENSAPLLGTELTNK